MAKKDLRKALNPTFSPAQKMQFAKKAGAKLAVLAKRSAKAKERAEKFYASQPPTLPKLYDAGAIAMLLRRLASRLQCKSCAATLSVEAGTIDNLGYVPNDLVECYPVPDGVVDELLGPLVVEQAHDAKEERLKKQQDKKIAAKKRKNKLRKRIQRKKIKDIVGPLGARALRCVEQQRCRAKKNGQ